MKKLWTFLIMQWPIVALVLLSISIFVTNYKPGTFLLGWDSTVPELNLPLNLQRFVYGVWQEYRGVGTLDGMAHTANIMHWFYVAFLSLFLPISIVRYVFTVAAHLMGGIGVYFLLSKELLAKNPNNKTTQVVSFIGALLYQFNFMTVQMFYAPLEIFTTHFAVLPWGVLTLLRYLRQPTRLNLFFLAAVNIAGLSQAHVPSVFIAYDFLLGFVLLAWHFYHKQTKRVLLVIGTFFIVNSFWGLPYIYSTLHKAPEISSSHINQLSTDEIFYRNQAWGDLKSVLTFGSFNLDYLDWNVEESKFEEMLRPWLGMYNSMPYKTITIIFSLTSICGALFAIRSGIRNKNFAIVGLGLGFLFFFSQLAIATPIVSIISVVLRRLIPFYHDVFRFTFTKFSTTYVFLLSIFFSYAIAYLIELRGRRTFSSLFFLLIMSAVLYIAHPIWKGFFFYPRLRIAVPNQYFSLQAQLQKLPNQGRTLILPAPSLYGWTYSSWGYRGSGFMWQMIEQPTVDRAFDAWSYANETLYEQLSRALVDNDSVLLKKVIDQYQLENVVVDESIVVPTETTFNPSLPEIKDMLRAAGMTQVWQEGQLSLFINSDARHFFTTTAPTKNSAISTYEYTTFDSAFSIFGPYYHDEANNQLPFSNLTQQKLDVITYENEQLLISGGKAKINGQLYVPSLTNDRYVTVGNLRYRNDVLSIEFLPAFEIKVGNTHHPMGTLPTQEYRIEKSPDKIVVGINGQVITLEQGEKKRIYLTEIWLNQPITISYFDESLATKTENTFVIDPENANHHTLPPETWSSVTTNQSITVNAKDDLQLVIPTVKENAVKEFLTSTPNNCDFYKQGSTKKMTENNTVTYHSFLKSAICDQITLNDSLTTIPYLLRIKGRNSQGRSLKFFIRNHGTNRVDQEQLVSKGTFDETYNLFSWQNSPESFYSLNIETRAFGNEPSKNSLENVELFALPFTQEWFSQIMISNSPNLESNVKDPTPIASAKLGSAFYRVVVSSATDEFMLNLSQGWSKGWIAVAKDHNESWFEATVLTHERYNGWANGWSVPKGEHEVLIMYWPQFLVFIGYTLLGLGSFVFLVPMVKSFLRSRTTNKLPTL